MFFSLAFRRPTALFLSCLLPSLVVAQSWSATTTAGFISNDNATNSAQEEKNDQALFAEVGTSTHRLLGRDLQGSLGFSALATHWWEYEGLDLAELNLNAGLRWKFGLGPYAPRLDLSLTTGRQIARVDEWSGNHLRLGATFSRRLSPAWLLAASTELNRLDARRAVYSHTQWNYRLTAHYDVNPDWRLSVIFRHRRGDQLSWCRNSWPAFVDNPQWEDGIFGGDWFPYRTSAELNGGSLNVSRALGRSSTAALGVESTRSTSVFHKTYRNLIFTLQYIHAF